MTIDTFCRGGIRQAVGMQLTELPDISNNVPRRGQRLGDHTETLKLRSVGLKEGHLGGDAIDEVS